MKFKRVMTLFEYECETCGTSYALQDEDEHAMCPRCARKEMEKDVKKALADARMALIDIISMSSTIKHDCEWCELNDPKSDECILDECIKGYCFRLRADIAKIFEPEEE